MTAVRYDHATRTYEGTDAAAVDSLDLDIGDGELLVLVGPFRIGQVDRAADARRPRAARRAARSTSATAT